MPPATQSAPNTAPTPPSAEPAVAVTHPHKYPRKKLKILLIFLLVCLIVGGVVGAYLIGKRGQRIIYQRPTPPPVTLPAQAIVVTDCVKGLGKQYVLPKDIPNGPIYNVKNSKVIAVEYNYKAGDLFINPNRLSETVIPLTKNYQVDHFTTSIGELKGGTEAEVQQVPIRVIMYMVPKAESDAITCTK